MEGIYESKFPPLGGVISAGAAPDPAPDHVDIQSLLQVMKQADVKYMKNFSVLTSKIESLRVLALGWSERELIICAGEVFKWSVRKQAVPIGSGLYLYDNAVKHLVFAGAASMGMENMIEEYKNMSRLCIVARNDSAYFSSLQELESSVMLSKNAIKIFPTLLELYPLQCKTVQNYGRFKSILPNSFRE